jgi:hypothetical protein
MFITAILPLSRANIYIITYQDPSGRLDTDSDIEIEQDYPLNQDVKNDDAFIYKLFAELANNRKEELEDKKNCIRLFGSIYGTKNQRIKCRQKFKNIAKKPKKGKRPRKNKQPNFMTLDPSLYQDFLYYNDDTEPTESKSQSDTENVDELSRTDTDDISTDEIDSHGGQSNDPVPNVVYIITNLRKSNSKPTIIKKRNMNVETSGSDSEWGSDNTPKRFQIINNGKGKLKSKYVKQGSDFSSVESEAAKKSDSSSVEEQTPKRQKEVKTDTEDYVPVEYYKPKRGKKKIVKLESYNFELKPKNVKSIYAKLDDENSLSVEDSTPLAQDSVKDVYIQGNKVYDFTSGGFRRRLPSFLPKRYRWNPDDIRNLGYYWFNGPQGRYPHYAVRP